MHPATGSFGILSHSEREMPSNPTTPPLVAAAEKDDTEAIEHLLTAGASVDETDASGRTALMAATQRNDLALARRLIEAGSDVNARDATQLTPYLCAGANGFAEILKLTLAAGADRESVNRFGGTPLLPSSE